jgi:hypothetical protein
MNSKISEDQASSIMHAMGGSVSSIDTFYPRMMEPLAKPSELELSPREFFYWCDKGIIDMPKAEKGQSPWSRLNLLDVFWIRIVKELRKFNLSFSAIVEIKKDLFQSQLDSLLEMDSTMTANTLASYKNDDLTNAVQGLINLSPEELEEIKKLYNHLFFPITALLSDILLFNRNIHIHICKSNDKYVIVFEGHSAENITPENMVQVNKQSHLTICLTELIAEFLLDKACEKMNIEFGLISAEETTILNAIRNKEITEIHIKKDQSEQMTMTTIKQGKMTDEDVTALKRLLRMNEYNEVRVVLRNNKHIYLENKTKQKL